ncbi:hypothetical protein HYH03_004805 [Edaphochlamys debaryana]|uniref:Uncharacterized protein n=1 Tax=Edaphochlamys debaryana TaxID=47281 RepID=A0A836C1R7_9CHLO|nr:hypothetical protein HYH03_004805 [Edaphochlamys debaryana]|eukprot:KAG2497216.1 hypothetical protein HYH03_004805 [Edaphochlamys debaryana]
MASSPKANSSSTKSTRDVEKALLTTNLVAALAFPAPVVLAPGPWHKLMFKEASPSPYTAGQPRNQDMNQFFALALARPPHAAPSGQPGRPQRFSSGGGGGGGGQPASTQSGQGDDAAAVGQMAQAWRHRRALLSQEAGRAGGHQGGDERRAPEPAFVRNGDPWEPLAQGEGGSSGHGGGGGRRLEDAQAEAPRLEAWREAEGDRGPTSGRAEEPAPAPGWTSARAWAEEVHRFLLNQPDHRAGVAQLRR